MITNTQRILYRDGYFPAYLKKQNMQVHCQGFGYDLLKIEEVKTDKVWKVELENGLVTYFSDCTVYIDVHWPKHISNLEIGDSLLTYSPTFEINGSQKIAKQLAKAFVLNDKDATDEILKKYRISSLNKFKLLANNTNLIGDFLCEVVKYHLKDFRYEYIVVKNIFTYEFLQELLLACSLFGIKAHIKKEKGKWILFIDRAYFMKAITNTGGYMLLTVPVVNIYEIPQDTQAFNVNVKTINNLVVNSIVVQGDS